MTGEQLPQWAQDRIDEDEAMGRSFDEPLERTGYLVGTILTLSWTLFWWVVTWGAVAAVLYIVGKWLVGP